jgi:RNA recognition motif-containing protein
VNEQGEHSRHLWVGNLDQGVHKRQLWDEFARVGKVESISRFPSHAFVDFVSVRSAEKAHKYLQVRFHIPHMPTRGSHTWAPYRFVHTLYTISHATRTTLQGLRLGSQCVMLDYARSDSVKERQRKENTKATGRPDRHRVRMRCDLRVVCLV